MGSSSPARSGSAIGPARSSSRIGAAAILGGVALGILVDFAKVRAPYPGAWPHVINVLCVAFFLAREYSARGARVAATDRQFEAAFEHGPIGKALLALDGRFLRVNRALCRVLGWTAEELGARRLRDVTHPDDLGSDEVEFQRLLDVPAYTVEKRLLRKDGEPVWALLAMSVVPDDHGRPLRVVAQMHDVTELRAHRERLEELVATRTRELSAAKDEAERANRAKSQFLAHISHEIRNPLHIILGYAQILELDPTLGGAQQQQVGIMHSSGKHLLTLMNDLLEMAKIEARHLELVEDRFDPWATLDEVERMFAREAASKGIEIEIECAPDLPRAIVGDGAKVKQILINLASNALKFTERGSIRFKASASAIADGCDAGQDRRRGHGDRHRGARRCADLPTVRAARRRQAGRRHGPRPRHQPRACAADGRRPHRGQRPGRRQHVHVHLRGEERRCGGGARGPGADHRCRGRRDEKSRCSSSTTWPSTGTSWRSCCRGPASRRARPRTEWPPSRSHADWRPDLVLIDLRMPGMGGLEAIQRMRAAGSTAAIGALSASALADDERQSLAFGADFFLGKPYDNRELMDRIARVLDTDAQGGRDSGWAKSQR